MTHDVYAMSKGNKNKDNDLIYNAQLTTDIYILNYGNKNKILP